MLFPSGNPFKCHEEVLYLQPLISPKCFDIFFPPNWGMLRRSRVRVLIFGEKPSVILLYTYINRHEETHQKRGKKKKHDEPGYS